MTLNDRTTSLLRIFNEKDQLKFFDMNRSIEECIRSAQFAAVEECIKEAYNTKNTPADNIPKFRKKIIKALNTVKAREV